MNVIKGESELADIDDIAKAYRHIYQCGTSVFNALRRIEADIKPSDARQAILDFIRAQGQEMEANEEIITFTENAMKEDEEKEEGKGRRAPKRDELLPDAVNLVMSTGQASASSLQRRFRVGYTRAARLIDEMEELNIVGPNMGSKPREILMNSEQAQAALAAEVES